MALNQDKILKFIEEGNFQGLQSYLNKEYHDIDSLIPPEEFINAFNNFISSDSKNITNSYKIIELLYQHFTDANRKTKYDNSQEHEDIKGLFKIYEKISAGKDYSIEDVVAVTRIKDFKVDSYQKKFELYQEKQTLRNVYKKADDLIERDLIYKIKYPENTSFIRKLLRIPPKRKSEDILNDLTKKLPELIDKLRAEIEKDPKFNDKKGNFLLSDYELSQVIYERLSLKIQNQLKIDKQSINGIFEKLNTKKVESVISHIKQNTQTGKELLHKAEELRKAIESSIPPYLLDLSKLKLKNLSGKNIIGFQEADLTSYAYNISSIFDNLLTNLISNIETYKGEPGREIELESLLLNAISLSNYLLDHNNNYFYFNAANIGQNYVLQDLLAQTQSTINKDLIAEHNNIKHNLKDKFSKFEKRGFEILANLNFGAALSKEEQQYLAKFFEYAIDNQEFNSRITRILNNNDQFVRNNAEMIAELRAFTYKTADLEGVGIITNKVEAILKKIKDNQTNLIEEEDKLSYQELGRLVKFLRNKDILMALKELKILEHSTILQYLNSNLQTSNNLYMELDSLIKNHINYEQGDIVMEVAKRNREFYSNKVNYEEKIRDYMSPYTHAAIGYKDNRGVFVSHVDQTYTKDKIEMDAVLSENFRIYPDKLIIDNDVKKQIIKALKIDNEDNLKQKMYDIYKGIASELHQLMQDENKDIKFDRDRAKDAFIADLMPFGFGHMGKDNIKSWAKEVLENKASLAQKIKDPGGKGYLFCSEFAAKMTVLSLVELEKQLFDKIKENDPNFEMPKGGLLKMPFHEYEDLGKVHPARLVKELSKSGAIEKVPEAEMVKNIIRTR